MIGLLLINPSKKIIGDYGRLVDEEKGCSYAGLIAENRSCKLTVNLIITFLLFISAKIYLRQK